jgi:hypothetical protein
MSPASSKPPMITSGQGGVTLAAVCRMGLVPTAGLTDGCPAPVLPEIAGAAGLGDTGGVVGSAGTVRIGFAVMVNWLPWAMAGKLIKNGFSVA